MKLKKKVFLSLIVFGIMGICLSVFIQQNQTHSAMEVLMGNIEALANGESATCNFSEVYKNQSTNTLNCSGNGSLCCSM